MAGTEFFAEMMKNEETGLPSFGAGRRIRKKKQKHPDEVSDWDSCEEEFDAKRCKRTSKTSPLYTAKQIKEENSWGSEEAEEEELKDISEFSESGDSTYSDELWPILTKQRTKLKRANGFEGTSDTERRLFACEFCPYENWRPSCVSRHMNQNHKSQLTCYVCSFKAKNFKLLNLHVRSHTGQGDTEKQVSQTAKENNEVNVNKDNNDDVKEDRQELSDETLHTQNSGDQEEKEEENESDDSSTPLKKPKKSKKKGLTLFKCEHCIYTSRQKCHVLRHMRERHLHQKRDKKWGPITCGECDYSTNRWQSMARHNLKHAGSKPYRCEVCNFKTSQKMNLERHRRIHTGESPFACDLCEYRCKQGYDLTKHKRTHTGEKPYACDLCDYRSVQSTTLAAHKKKAHREKGKNEAKRYACDLCHFSSKGIKSLHSHMKKSHKTKESPTLSTDTSQFSLHDLGTIKIEMEEIKLEDMEMVGMKQEPVEDEEYEDYKLLEL